MALSGVPCRLMRSSVPRGSHRNRHGEFVWWNALLQHAPTLRVIHLAAIHDMPGIP